MSKRSRNDDGSASSIVSATHLSAVEDALKALFAITSDFSPEMLKAVCGHVDAIVENCASSIDQSSIDYWDTLHIPACDDVTSRMFESSSLGHIPRAGMPQVLSDKLQVTQGKIAIATELQERYNKSGYRTPVDLSNLKSGRGAEELVAQVVMDPHHLDYYRTVDKYERAIWKDQEIQDWMWSQCDLRNIENQNRILLPLIKEACFAQLVEEHMIMYVKSKRCKISMTENPEAGYCTITGSIGGPCLRCWIDKDRVVHVCNWDTKPVDVESL